AVQLPFPSEDQISRFSPLVETNRIQDGVDSRAQLCAKERIQPRGKPTGCSPSGNTSDVHTDVTGNDVRSMRCTALQALHHSRVGTLLWRKDRCGTVVAQQGIVNISHDGELSWTPHLRHVNGGNFAQGRARWHKLLSSDIIKCDSTSSGRTTAKIVGR